MSEPRTDYDSPWKEVLESYFAEFMAFFFPQAHEDIDWSRDAGVRRSGGAEVQE